MNHTEMLCEYFEQKIFICNLTEWIDGIHFFLEKIHRCNMGKVVIWRDK